MEKENKTGYATIDQPWMKFYTSNIEQIKNMFPSNKTIWDVTEESLEKHSEIPLIEYFGNKIRREDFINYVGAFAKSFRVLGVEPGDLIPLCVPATPESYALFFAANAIGAVPYFQKLDINHSNLINETKGAKIAVVFDKFWNKVNRIFEEERFKNIIITTASDSMLFPLKQITKMKDYIERTKDSINIPKSTKYLWINEVLDISHYYTGNYKVPFVPNRVAVITTSSGTTSNAVKGIMDTNEGILASVYSFMNAETGYTKGKRTLTCFPPTASTSLNTLQIVPTLTGGTIIFDPRVDSSLWYKQLMNYKPDITVSTGSVWEKFIKQVLEKEAGNKRIDLSWIDFFILGGSATTPEILNMMNSVIKERGAKDDFHVGYGFSEVFGPLTLTKHDDRYPVLDKTIPVLNTGIPLPGYIVGIFDENGKELPYGTKQRGELWVKTPANMHGYFGKEELTKNVNVDGWIHSGDLCEIDKDGNVYCYGRLKNTIVVNNEKKYLFDITNSIRTTFNLHDVMIEKKQLENNNTSIVIYFVQEDAIRKDSKELIQQIDEYLSLFNLFSDGYKEYDELLPINPATLKPRNKEKEGFVKYINSEEYSVSFEEIALDTYVKKCEKVYTRILNNNISKR